MAEVAVGKKVPAFKAASTGGGAIAGKDLLGSPYVLYFYPKDDTPGCTMEGQDFRDHFAEFKRRDVRVFGVSRDSLASHDRFKAKHGLPFDLLSDPDEALCRLFDVIKQKNMYGKKVVGIERSTFLIDPKGVLRNEWRKVRVNGHVAAVLAAAEML
jgi:peroxiredoxin Q/BCP